MSTTRFKDQNVLGIRLVIDRDTNEFWLFKDDNTPGLVHGKLGASAYDYNNSNSQSNGTFSGQLEVYDIPFELAKFDVAKIESILKTLPDPDKITNINNESKEMSEKKFEFFNPETQANMKKPPADLSRKLKKKWFKERATWLEEHNEVKEALEKAAGKEEVKATPKPEPKQEVKSEVKATEEKPKSEPVKEVVKDKEIEKEKVTDKVEKVEETIENDLAKIELSSLGAGNKFGTMSDVPEGYFIGRYFEQKSQYAILQVPEELSKKLGEAYFLVFPKHKTAEFMQEKLMLNPSFAVIVEGCSIYPITSLQTSEWTLKAAIITNVASFLQSI